MTPITVGDNVDTVIVENVPVGDYQIGESSIDGYEFQLGRGENCIFTDEVATASLETDSTATCVFINGLTTDEEDRNTDNNKEHR